MSECVSEWMVKEEDIHYYYKIKKMFEKKVKYLFLTIVGSDELLSATTAIFDINAILH